MADTDSYPNHIVAGNFWHTLEDGRIQCDLCPRYCKLREGQRGLCFVRKRMSDQMVLTTYGKSSGFAIDPIEKKPLSHFYPGTSVLSFGTAGCNLACKFCQNWDISKSREVDRLTADASPEKISMAAHQHGCRSVAFTYNDPVIFHEYARDIAMACHEVSVKTIAVTAGYITEQARKSFFQHIDAINVDLKAFTEEFYYRICGGELQPVLDTLNYLKHETDKWFEITTLLIPGKNDSIEEIKRMSQWILHNLGDNIPLHFTAFHPDWKMRDIPRTPHETLIQARQEALKLGLKYVYIGNVHDEKRNTTYCHHCNTALIARDWHQILQWNLDFDGRCLNCNTQLEGRFEGPPGITKGLPVRLRM